MEKLEWRVIPIKGFGKYEVSIDGGIREFFNKKYVSTTIVKDVKCALINVNGKRMNVPINYIVKATFQKDNNSMNMILYNRNEYLSDNEEDYGKGANKHHWEELKREIKRVSMLRKKIGINELL